MITKYIRGFLEKKNSMNNILMLYLYYVKKRLKGLIIINCYHVIMQKGLIINVF